MNGWVLGERALLAAGVVGLLTSTIFTLLTLVGAWRFRQAQRRDEAEAEREPGFLPAVTVFKPLHGLEPGLRENLRSFFEQDYLERARTAGLAATERGVSRVEMIFAARQMDDAGLKLAREVAAEFPEVTTHFCVSGEPWAPNAKVCSLAAMAPAATHDLWVISDSDVRVGRDYLRRVVLPFRSAEVGCATCLYRGAAVTSGLWSRLEAVGMTVEMSSGVCVVNMMEPMQFALGPTMAARRGCVEEIGGFRAMAEYCADDFVLGNWIAEKGHRVELATNVIDHSVRDASFLDSMRHQVRWMKSTRFSRPKGHFGTSLTFAVPFALLAWGGALALHHTALAWMLLGVGIGGRMLQAAVLARVLGERKVLLAATLYPLRDLLGMAVWALSYAGHRIVWRGELYDLTEGGRMVRSTGEEPAQPVARLDPAKKTQG